MIDFELQTIIPSIISISFGLGLAFFVFLRGFRRPANLGFAIGTIGLALQEMGAVMATLASDPTQALFWGKITILGDALIGGGWFLFAITFAHENLGEVFRKKIPLFGLFFLGLLAFLAFPLFEPALSTGRPLRYLQVNQAGFSFFVLYLFVLAFILMHLEQTFRAASGIVTYQIKYLILGIGAIAAIQVFLTGQVLLYSRISLNFLPLYSVALSVSYLLILFAIVRHRLLNIDLFVSRYVVYKSVTLLAVGAYLAIVGLTIIGVQHFGKESYTGMIPLIVFAALLGLVILLLSEKLRRKIQTFINVNFYKNKYDYRNKWQEFTHAVGSKLVLPELLPSLVSWVAETVGTDAAAIWLFDSDRNRYYLASRRGFSSAPTVWSDQGSLIKAVKIGASPLELTNKNLLFEEIAKECPEFFESNPLTAWVPISSKEEVVGILGLGRKITDEHYDYHDFELLMTITAQASGQIDRVRLIEELGVVRELKAIHTLSSFFLHDLKNYTSTLSLLAQNVAKHGSNPEFQKDAFLTIQGTVDKMNQLIKHITVVAKGLVLSRSEVDLNQLIDSTLSGLKGALGLKGRISSIYGELPIFSGDPEQLINVLRNLIINACNASDAEGFVSIETRSEKNHVYFSVSDEGCGMTEEFISTKLFKPLRTTKAAGWGIGLFQCQQIVRAHDGKIHVESEVGVGSTFTLELPVGGKK